MTAKTELSGEGGIWLKIQSDREIYRFLYSTDGVKWQLLGTGLVVGLCTESTRTMTFTGTYLGMFAENGDAEFADFSVRVKEEEDFS